LLLDIYQPDQGCPMPRPTVMFVHGGGFNSGSRKGENVDAIARDLAQRGINLLSIDYRVQGDSPVISSEFAAFESDFQALNTTEPASRVTAFVAAVEDSLRALRWAEDNAAQYCIDPARLGLWGSSAGAYTVLHLAYSMDEYSISRPQVRVVVDYWGGLIRDGDLEAGEPPLFVLHGTADPTVPFSEATEITGRADGVGVSLTFYTITGGQHGYDGIGFFTLSVDGQSLGNKTATFVDAHLRDGGQPVYERRTLAR
jgi:acetyl esterase/lipase